LPNRENPIVKKRAAIILPLGSRLLTTKRNKLKITRIDELTSAAPMPANAM
jgi:hypothetical protein